MAQVNYAGAEWYRLLQHLVCLFGNGNRAGAASDAVVVQEVNSQCEDVNHALCLLHVRAARSDRDEGAETKQGENARITCIDDQGRTWWLTEDSQVGDWLRYKEEGGEVTPYVEPVEEEPEDG